MAEEYLTRAQARAQGLKRYMGSPCKYGHPGEKFADGSCVVCRLARNKAWAEANPEKVKAKCRSYRERNIEKIKAWQAEYRVEWYAKNKEAKLAKDREYAKANPEVARKATRAWQKRNPEKASTYAQRWYSDPQNAATARHRRRARKLDAGGTHTQVDLKRILTAQGHRCAYCRADLRKVKRHLDHITPLARGGSNDRTNLQYLCAPCNLAKGSRDPIDFAREQGLLI